MLHAMPSPVGAADRILTKSALCMLLPQYFPLLVARLQQHRTQYVADVVSVEIDMHG